MKNSNLVFHGGSLLFPEKIEISESKLTWRKTSKNGDFISEAFVLSDKIDEIRIDCKILNESRMTIVCEEYAKIEAKGFSITDCENIINHLKNINESIFLENVTNDLANDIQYFIFAVKSDTAIKGELEDVLKMIKSCDIIEKDKQRISYLITKFATNYTEANPLKEVEDELLKLCDITLDFQTALSNVRPINLLPRNSWMLENLIANSVSKNNGKLIEISQFNTNSGINFHLSSKEVINESDFAQIQQMISKNLGLKVVKESEISFKLTKNISERLQFLDDVSMIEELEADRKLKSNVNPKDLKSIIGIILIDSEGIVKNRAYSYALKHLNLTEKEFDQYVLRNIEESKNINEADITKDIKEKKKEAEEKLSKLQEEAKQKIAELDSEKRDIQQKIKGEFDDDIRHLKETVDSEKKKYQEKLKKEQEATNEKLKTSTDAKQKGEINAKFNDKKNELKAQFDQDTKDSNDKISEEKKKFDQKLKEAMDKIENKKKEIKEEFDLSKKEQEAILNAELKISQQIELLKSEKEKAKSKYERDKKKQTDADGLEKVRNEYQSTLSGIDEQIKKLREDKNASIAAISKKYKDTKDAIKDKYDKLNDAIKPAVDLLDKALGG
jgi:hypothetical protein